MDFLLQVVVPLSPDSATRGDIVITVLESGLDRWAGVWRLDKGEWETELRRMTLLDSQFGSRAELVDWAMEQEVASRWIFDKEASLFVRLG